MVNRRTGLNDKGVQQHPTKDKYLVPPADIS